MKNLLWFSCFFALIILTNACKKDELREIDEGIEQSAQTPQLRRSCGMANHQKRLMEDPSYQHAHELKLEKVNNTISLRSDCDEPIILPVAVHFQGVNNADLSCLRSLAQAQIESMNADFKSTNTDIGLWNSGAASSFPGITAGEACFEFCLASQNHPTGFGLNDGDPAVTVNATNGDSDNRWAGYINIFVQPNTGVLGYAPLGGNGNGDGIVIDAAAFGSGGGCGNIQPQAPFNLGRTLTHEMGHYLLLDHIWGEGCGQDDAVADTPNSADSYYDCPNVGVSSCGSVDLHMNYMDYTNDACMYMFTAGQVSRSSSYIQSSLQSLMNSSATVCGGDNGGGGDTPTCTDGIQNGSETGVDCGGPDCVPCDTPPSGCNAPQNLQSSGITENGATLSWGAVIGAQQYILQFRTQGSNQWMSVQSNQATITLNALATETAYEWRVKTECADASSNYSTLAAFTTLEHGCDEEDEETACTENEITLELVLDDYGSETIWEVYDGSDNLVATGGPYEDGQDGTLVTETFCLEDDCYFFVIYDEAYDGICCDYGQGSFRLIDGEEEEIYADYGDFGAWVQVVFCLEQAFNQTDVSQVRHEVKAKDAQQVEQARARKRG